MADPSTTAPDSDEPEIVLEHDRAIVVAIAEELDEARELVKAGRRDEALEICLRVLQYDELPLRSGAKLSVLLRDLGQTDISDQLKELILAQIDGKTHRMRDPDTALLPAIEALAEIEQYDLAEQLCHQAIRIAPDNIHVVMGYAAFLIHLKRQDEALDLAVKFCDARNSGFSETLHIALIFALIRFEDGAHIFFDRAKTKVKSKTQRAELEHLMAANGMSVANLDQHGMAVAVFDGFAASYDTQLAKLNNNGPNMVFTALEQLGLAKTKTRRVLDAGCGTGLCAGFLRDYSKELVGVDLSVNMLEKAKAKDVYDTLARTDLAVASTYPEGSFDLIVCADVLVYVGNLDQIFTNFRRVLSPGGLLLITCETETDPSVKAGFRLGTSGRYRHSDTYLTALLTRTGFPKPKLFEHARLRNEMAKPVLGTVMAVQKPALFMA